MEKWVYYRFCCIQIAIKKFYDFAVFSHIDLLFLDGLLHRSKYVLNRKKKSIIFFCFVMLFCLLHTNVPDTKFSGFKVVIS